MSTKPFEQAADRIERALLRIERAVERVAMVQGDDALDGRDVRLRSRVSAALGELDQIIREAERG